MSLNFTREDLNLESRRLGFVRDTYEKMLRLVLILREISSNPEISSSLSLKGGTAINLTVFALPRLSVDIDLDYTKGSSREVMLSDRKLIYHTIINYMNKQGYTLHEKTKQYFALDSFVFSYINAGGVRDNIKIEINYMLRCHFLPSEKRDARFPSKAFDFKISCINPIEIFSAKVVALLNRTTPRDLFDVFMLSQTDLLTSDDLKLLKKGVVFYSAKSSVSAPQSFEFSKIMRLNTRMIKTELIPVLRQAFFDLPEAQKQVLAFLESFLIPEKEDYEFWKLFNQKEYHPELIFSGEELRRIKSHPMALWKCRFS